NDAQTGKLHPWVLLVVFWGAAFISVSIHYLLRYLAQAAAWARHSWGRHAVQRARLGLRAWISAALAWAALRRSVLRLVRRHLSQASRLAGQGWDGARDSARRAWEQQMAGARRAPGTLVGWSRSALKALRA